MRSSFETPRMTTTLVINVINNNKCLIRVAWVESEKTIIGRLYLWNGLLLNVDETQWCTKFHISVLWKVN